MSIALVYSAELRNNGTPVLFWDSLKRGMGIGDRVVRYTPIGKIPEHQFYLYIDDGRDDLTWECPHPNAYYAIDTHLGYDYRLNKARGFDRVYCAQRNGAERMQADGVDAKWLPLACHPPAHPNLEELMRHPDRQRLGSHGFDRCWDVVFVGFINQGAGEGSHNRLDYLDALFKALPNFWCTTNCFFEDMAIRYARGRVGVNVSIKDDLNMRFFEILSIGTCLLTNRDVVGLEDLGFVEGEHFVGFEGIEEMISQCKWCLANPEKREEIAKAGHEKVRAEHTYVHRAARILEDAGIKEIT